jgi:DTW domain-containing protein
VSEEKPSRVEKSRDRERASLGMEIPVEPQANQVRVIVLQHPQEPDKELGSASLLVRALDNADLRVGLSWRSLRAVAGEDALPAQWAVLYLGAQGKPMPGPVNFVNQKNEPIPAVPGLKGLIVLDGTWSQAKALWWRNSWLLKLKRIVLRPPQRSRYGRLRKEPRAEAVSTIEAVALALGQIDPAGSLLKEHLEGAFQRMLDEYRRRAAPIAPRAKP